MCGIGDLEGKLMALYGKVMTFDNFGSYLFHLSPPGRPQTLEELRPVSWDETEFHIVMGLRFLSLPPFPPLPLSPKQNRSELSQGNKNVLFLADGTESRLGNKINLLFLSLPLL